MASIAAPFPLELAAAWPAPCPASSLPPELISLIIEYVVEMTESEESAVWVPHPRSEMARLGKGYLCDIAALQTDSAEEQMSTESEVEESEPEPEPRVKQEDDDKPYVPASAYRSIPPLPVLDDDDEDLLPLPLAGQRRKRSPSLEADGLEIVNRKRQRQSGQGASASDAETASARSFSLTPRLSRVTSSFGEYSYDPAASTIAPMRRSTRPRPVAPPSPNYRSLLPSTSTRRHRF
uniref:Uncharacterized protein n=1 Tax=Mycena chlorophos TaxID=658473 RepID=A0ABQ0L2J9_MYCCL|nr:predicted protein [Mycena chlorophos]